jgi:hypothetical protein
VALRPMAATGDTSSMDAHGPEEVEGILHLDHEMVARIEGLCRRLDLDEDSVIAAALGLLDWYVTVDEHPTDRVMIVDADCNARAPGLTYANVNEDGVSVWPLLMSERDPT